MVAKLYSKNNLVVEIVSETECDFTKSKEYTTDFEYYISNFGILLYSNNKNAINKETTHHTYAMYNSLYKWVKSVANIKDIKYFLSGLLNIYISKMGYMCSFNDDLENNIKIINIFCKDMFVKEAIEVIKNEDIELNYIIIVFFIVYIFFFYIFYISYNIFYVFI